MPHLEYADFRGFDLINEFTNEEFQELLDSSQNIKQLFIDSDHIQSLKIPNTVTKLDCSSCYQLTSLDLSNCTTLTELNCDNCPQLTSLNLSACINLTKLYCCHCEQLTSLDLSACINLTKLEYRYCSQLTSLNLSNCTNLRYLGCSNCSQLTSLDLSACTSLTSLGCSNCSQLTSLNLSNCTNLIYLVCSNCSQLTSLDLSACTSLTSLGCSNCSQLTSLDLSACTSLTSLGCSNCSQLTSLDLSACTNLTRLDCVNCHQLTSLDLSACTNLTRLDCSYCTQLTSLHVEALPQCQILQYRDTPNLTQLPQLPQTTQVYSSGSFSTFTVDLAYLEQNPTSILMQLGHDYLLQGHSFPNIVFIDSRLDGSSPGIDVGGLRRHLVSTLFENLVKNKELFAGEKAKKLPILAYDNQEQDKKDYFRTIGRLFALCLTSSLLTGIHFDEHLFTTIRWIMNNSNPRPDHFEERIYCLLRNIDYNLFSTSSEEDRLSYITENPIVYPAILIAEEMKAALQQNPIPEGLEFQRAIQGIEVTPSALLAKTIFKEGSERQQSYMQNFFRNWANETQPENLVTFVKFATGNRSLDDNEITIYLYPSRDSEQLPIAHSCTQTLEMPIYSNQETFNAKINTALNLGGAEGFQFG